AGELLQLLLVERDKPVALRCGRRAHHDGAEAERNAIGRPRTAFYHYFSSQGDCRSDKLGVVECRKRLQWGVCPRAAGADDLAVWRVEGNERWIRRGTPPERVDSSAVAILARTGGPGVGISRTVPDAVGLERHDARPTDLFAEQTADGQGLVA